MYSNMKRYKDLIGLITEYVPLMLRTYEDKNKDPEQAIATLIEARTNSLSKYFTGRKGILLGKVFRHNRYLSTENFSYDLRRARYNKNQEIVFKYNVFSNLDGIMFDIEVRQSNFRGERWIVSRIDSKIM
jgi:hypothetical protein